MGNNYVILYKDNTKRECFLYQLSLGLSTGCSVFEIIEGKEILLGVISHKALVYIAKEFSSHASKEYFTDSDMKYSLEVTRRWLDNPDSISDEDIYFVFKSDRSRSYYLDIYLLSTILSPETYFYSVCNEIINISDKKKEALRQGKFIIDFLKSDKHLFMV